MANAQLISAKNQNATSRAIGDSSVEVNDEIFASMSRANKILVNLHTVYCESATRAVKYTNGTNVSYGLSSSSLDELQEAFDI